MHASRMWPALLGTMISAVAMSGGWAAAQPANSPPNPYRTVEGWAKMPEGRTWGATSAVDVAPDGRSIWVGERCGANTCAGSSLPAILQFDEAGALKTSFGAGMFVFPHGFHVDRERQRLAHRRAGKGREGTPGLQVQPGRKAPPDAREGGSRRRGSGRLQSAVRRGGRPQRRHLRGGRARRGLERAHREVLEGREVHQDLGQEGNGPR